MPPKKVHWKPTVEKYASNSSSGDSRPSTPDQASSSEVPRPPSRPPQLTRSRIVPLPASSSPQPFRLHTALSPETSLEIDLSMPSQSLAQHPRLTLLVNELAVDPPQTRIEVHGVVGIIHFNIEVRSSGVRADGSITVGDVFSRINQVFRGAPDSRYPNIDDAARFMERRIQTVNGYFPNLPSHEAQRGERRPGIRMVDLLLGNTQFAGLAPSADSQGRWELALSVPARYAPRSRF